MIITYSKSKFIAKTEYRERLLPKQAGMRWDPQGRSFRAS